MQLFKIKLLEGHKAYSDQIAGEYLGNNSTIDPALYTYRKALIEAKKVGGVIEKHGREYTTNKMSIIQLNKSELSDAVIRDLNGREAFKDADPDLNEFIYYGDVFAGMLNEHLEKSEIYFNQDTIDELLILDTLCGNFEYIMLTMI